MATITKRGDNYRIRVSCGYNSDGKQVVQTKTWKPDSNLTEKQKEKELRRQIVLFEESCSAGQITSAVKLEPFVKQWFKEYAEVNLKPTTLWRYERDSKRVLKSLGHIRIDRIPKRDIQRFISELHDLDLDGKGKKMALNSIKSHVKFISTVFNYAIKIQMVSNNPCKGVDYPKNQAVERPFYTIEETRQLLDLFKKERDINLKYVVFFTIELLKRYREYQDKYKAEMGTQWIETGRVFTSVSGDVMNTTLINGYFIKFCKRTGMKHIPPHCFRHTNASIMIFSGVDVKTVQSCLGHEDCNTTLNTYAHVFQAAQAKAMDAVANAINFQ